MTSITVQTQRKRYGKYMTAKIFEPFFVIIFYLDKGMGNLAHYQASVKASMEKMFNGQLGKTNWMITCKEFIKMITLFLDDGLLILSIKNNGNYDQIIQKIQGLKF